NIATLLNNGMVLIAGGFPVVNGDANTDEFASAELYQSSTLTPPGLSSISVSPSNPSIPIGTTRLFTATGTFSNSTTQQLSSVIWSSSSATVASVTNDSTNIGHAFGLATGSTTVSACAGSVCGSTTLVVNTNPSVTGLNPTSGMPGIS